MMETNTETDLYNFLLTVVSPGVEDVEGDVQFPRELSRGSLTEETLNHMFGFCLGLGHTKVGLGVLQGGGEPGHEEDGVAEPQVGLPGRFDRGEESWAIPGVEDRHLVQDFTGGSSRHQATS